MFFAAHEARSHPLSLSNEVHHMFHPMRTSENNYTHWRKKCEAWNKTFCGLRCFTEQLQPFTSLFRGFFIWVYVRPISLSPRAKAEPITASICQPGLFVLVSFSSSAWWDHQPRCCASVSRVNASIAERPVLYHLTLFPANFSQAQSYSTCIRHSLSLTNAHANTHTLHRPHLNSRLKPLYYTWLCKALSAAVSHLSSASVAPRYILKSLVSISINSFERFVLLFFVNSVKTTAVGIGTYFELHISKQSVVLQSFISSHIICVVWKLVVKWLYRLTYPIINWYIEPFVSMTAQLLSTNYL